MRIFFRHARVKKTRYASGDTTRARNRAYLDSRVIELADEGTDRPGRDQVQKCSKRGLFL